VLRVAHKLYLYDAHTKSKERFAGIKFLAHIDTVAKQDGVTKRFAHSAIYTSPGNRCLSIFQDKYKSSRERAFGYSSPECILDCAFIGLSGLIRAEDRTV
jgi:hypothetical protein